MKDIDFLPAKYHEATAKRQTQAWRVVVLLMFIGLLAAAMVGQYGLRLSAEHELAIVRQHYEATSAESTRLATLEQSLKPCQAEAELWTYLRRPWPRTRILNSLLKPLPESIIINRIELETETVAAQPGAQPAAGPAGTADKAVVDKASPAERDLRQLRREAEERQMVVTLEGTTSESLSLHSYLGKLGSDGMFARAEVSSIESVDKAHPETSQFRARLIVRPAYGQRGGPTINAGRAAQRPATEASR